jgi:DNA sulfur modification protein DndD
MLNLWSTVTNEYTQETRVVIEKRATETFRLLTNNPKGYNKLELNSGFGVKILDSDGYVVPAPSPGAQQVVAISLIDALRQTSDIEFPILFDTPGASIDKVHRDKIIKHFWSKRDEQLIILAHSGEFRPDEVEKENKELLARTWQLDFNSGINSTVVTPRLVR